MKKIFSFAAALAVIFTASCNKEMNPSEGLAPEGNTVKVTMNVKADPATKVILDGLEFKWEENDEIFLRWGNTPYSSLTECDKLSASSEGENVAFVGEFAKLPANENLYAYSAASPLFVTSGGVVFRKDVSNILTGKLEDLKDNAVFATYVGRSSIKKTYAEDNTTITALEFDAVMKTFFSVVKINVPEEMGFTQITMSAGEGGQLAGTLKLHAARSFGKVGLADADDALYRRYPTDKQYSEITVTDGGEVLSGDIYFVVLPDAYDEDKKEYYSNIESLTFKLSNVAGDFTFTSKLKSPIYRASLKDLGSIPATLAPAGTLCLTGGSKSDVKVNIKYPNSAYKFYYEIAASREECKTPTASSAEFDLENGISQNVTTSYGQYYIKVFADTESAKLEDCYIEGYLRTWRFLQDCPTAKVLAGWTQESTPVTTSDGLYISNSKSGNIDYKQSTDFMKLMTPYVSINAVPEHNSKCWLNFYVGSDSRGYNLNVGNATGGKATYNGYVTKHSVTGSGTNCFTWYLGDVTPGLNLALRGDGKHNYYRMSMLEVL
jgi:hypothetical protein